MTTQPSAAEVRAHRRVGAAFRSRSRRACDPRPKSSDKSSALAIFAFGGERQARHRQCGRCTAAPSRSAARLGTGEPAPDAFRNPALSAIHFDESDVGPTRARIDLTGERYSVACQYPLAAGRRRKGQSLVDVRNVRRSTRRIVLGDLIGAAKGCFAGGNLSRGCQRHGRTKVNADRTKIILAVSRFTGVERTEAGLTY